jgi:hypothetical protein
MKTKTKSKPVEKKAETYTAIVNVLGKKYMSTGKSILDAISILKPGICKGKAILTVKVGDVSKDKILMPATVNRLFNSHGLTKELAIKNVSNLFQGL